LRGLSNQEKLQWRLVVDGWASDCQLFGFIPCRSGLAVVESLSEQHLLRLNRLQEVPDPSCRKAPLLCVLALSLPELLRCQHQFSL
jgi:hypothetical protein